MSEIFQAPIVFPGRRDTSQVAAVRIIPAVERLERAVWNEIRACGGATSDEVELHLSLPHQTVSARIHAMMRRGSLVDSGRRRPTRSNRPAIVWESRELTSTKPFQRPLTRAISALEAIVAVAQSGRDDAARIEALKLVETLAAGALDALRPRRLRGAKRHE